MKRLIYAALLAVILAVLLTPQSSPSQPIVVTSVPTWGKNGTLQGLVPGGATPGTRLYVYVFVPDIGWHGAPACSSVPISRTGEFSVDLGSVMDRYATRFNAYLVPVSVAVPCVETVTSVPAIVLSNAQSQISVPRMERYKTISFSGLEWYVKTAPLKVYPGPQYFAEDNVTVDSAGRLHLKVNRCKDSWCAAEIYTKERVGYGAYAMAIDSPLHNLDRNLTLGLFTWDAFAPEQSHREWDVEFARWGDAAAPNAQYVVQPYTRPNHLRKFSMSAVDPTVHRVMWTPTRMSFVSSATSSQICRWTFGGGVAAIPSPGDAHLHLNFYIGSGQAPAVPAGSEVIVSRIEFSAL